MWPACWASQGKVLQHQHFHKHQHFHTNTNTFNYKQNTYTENTFTNEEPAGCNASIRPPLMLKFVTVATVEIHDTFQE